MGQLQHICSVQSSATRGRCLRPRICLRKGCGGVFQPRRWNQRYCQDPECLRLVRRWQAAKRQRQHRENVEHRQRHCEAERQRRKRCREQAAARCELAELDRPGEPTQGEEDGAWSRSKHPCGNFCNRAGCYAPLRCSPRARARYCSQKCAQALRRVLDRERKWLHRNTYAGRFKRQLEYQQARRRRAGRPASLAES